MLHPNQFEVNEAWIAFKVNGDESFITVADEPYDMYVLMDAASTYVLGHIISRTADGTPQEKEVEDIFNKAWQTKKQWPKKFIITENSTADKTFRKQAEKNGLPTEYVPLSDLESIVSPLKESFVSDFFGSSG